MFHQTIVGKPKCCLNRNCKHPFFRESHLGWMPKSEVEVEEPKVEELKQEVEDPKSEVEEFKSEVEQPKPSRESDISSETKSTDEPKKRRRSKRNKKVVESSS